MSDGQTAYDALGGLDGLRTILHDFYDRLYADVLIGFFFQPFEKAHLIEQQARFMGRALGGDVAYDGKSMPAAHRHHPILPGHFDRRHTVLRQTLLDHQVPAAARDEWLTLDQRLRSHVLKTSEPAVELGHALPDERIKP